MIEINKKNYSPPSTRYIGIVFLVLGILALFGTVFFGILLTVTGFLMIFSRTTLQVDIPNERIRECLKILVFRIGDWKDYSKHPHISVLREDMESKLTSRGNAELTNKHRFYTVYLLSSSHRNKIQIDRFKSFEDAKQDAGNWCEKLDRAYVDYEPVLSQKNSQRRNRRS